MDTVATERDALRRLVAEQLPRLYSVARRLVGDEAEDAVQDCLLKAVRGFARLEQPDAGPAWLMSILVNCCRDRGRARSRGVVETDLEDLEAFSLYRRIADEDPFPYSDSLHLDFLELFGTEDVRAILLSMPEHYRVPLVLVHMQGFSTKEVARIVDAPLGTVLARLHRGRKLFEKLMWEYAERNGLLREGVVRP